jgi:hypothetical protein
VPGRAAAGPPPALGLRTSSWFLGLIRLELELRRAGAVRAWCMMASRGRGRPATTKRSWISDAPRGAAAVGVPRRGRHPTGAKVQTARKRPRRTAGGQNLSDSPGDNAVGAIIRKPVGTHHSPGQGTSYVHWGSSPPVTRPGVGSLSRKRYIQCVEHNRKGGAAGAGRHGKGTNNGRTAGTAVGYGAGKRQWPVITPHSKLVPTACFHGQ